MSTQEIEAFMCTYDTTRSGVWYTNSALNTPTSFANNLATMRGWTQVRRLASSVGRVGGSATVRTEGDSSIGRCLRHTPLAFVDGGAGGVPQGPWVVPGAMQLEHCLNDVGNTVSFVDYACEVAQVLLARTDALR